MDKTGQDREQLVFGEEQAGIAYRHRPGAYALIYKDDGAICLVNTPEGYMLPGGGIEKDESKEAALLREISEETGFRVKAGPYLGTAFHFKLSPKEGYIKKECFYYACTFEQVERERVEKDHIAEWLSYTDAVEKLREKEPAHCWAVETFFAHKPR